MSEVELDLRGRAALITGAGAGPGRAIALALAEKGAAVAVCDLNIERADAVVDAIRSAGGRAIPLQADVANRFQVANMIERARDAFGAIHLLFNGASVFHAEPLLQVDEWNWRRQIEVTVSGTFFATQLTARVMADEGGGSIINLASRAASSASLPAGVGYVAGQSALIGLTRQAARELAPHGIRVNCIAAELTAAPASAIASAALFLCSDAAISITGEILVVDGELYSPVEPNPASPRAELESSSSDSTKATGSA